MLGGCVGWFGGGFGGEFRPFSFTLTAITAISIANIIKTNTARIIIIFTFFQKYFFLTDLALVLNCVDLNKNINA